MSVFEQLRLLHPGWRDVLEVVIVSYAIYRVLLVLRRTRAMHVLGGIIALAAAYGVAYALHLSMIIYLLTLVFSYGAIALLVVFGPVEEYVQSGAEMQARVSADLLATIFTPYSPLHDGAVLIRGDTIIGAGCILPLSQAALVDRSLGTRHRAALGLSEETDALVVVVSEETATITVAENGRLNRGVSPLQVRELVAGRPLREALPDSGIKIPL